MSLAGLALPLLHRLDPERAHGLTLKALKAGLAGRAREADPPALGVELWGKRFPNPVGLSAGFDKNAEVMAPMLALGFGFVEVGSITPRPQPGNPRPRIFRLPEDRAVINRLGFNNEGLAAAEARLSAYREGGGAGIVGVNLGKNKDSAEAAPDYAAGAERLARYADYLVINVSSPNTPGLRALQSREELVKIVAAVRGAVADMPPLVLKIAPDLQPADKEEIAKVALEEGLSGLIVSNTTIARPESLKSPNRAETGGLSGRPLFAPSTALLAEMRDLTGGKVPLIGVGGIFSGADAAAKLEAGATLVQLYTGLVYEGPALVQRIKRELAAGALHAGEAR